MDGPAVTFLLLSAIARWPTFLLKVQGDIVFVRTSIENAIQLPATTVMSMCFVMSDTQSYLNITLAAALRSWREAQ